MATGSAPSSASARLPRAGSAGRPRPRAALVDRRLNTARRHIKLVELAWAIMAWLAGAQLVLLAAVLMDHWIWPLGFWGRAAACLTLLAGSAAWLVWRIGPLLLHSIHPLFAARMIERSDPSLKNSLINYLLLRDERRRLSRWVREALERAAAADVARVDVVGAVDRSPLIRWGYVLAAVTAVTVLYTILSPKDPFHTAARVAVPWAPIPAPTRVRIDDVRPGDTQAYLGDQVAVSARVDGLRDGEPVMLYYSTPDGQAANRPVPMSLDDRGFRHACRVPPDPAGLQQDITYWIRAGDARSPVYHVRTRPAPSMWIERLEYHYPKYTGLADRSVDGQGDIRALEGARVTVRARASEPIRSAYLELFADDGQRRMVPLEAEGDQAWGPLRLELPAPDERPPAGPGPGATRREPLHMTYQARFTTRQGVRNPRPVAHTIDVLPDLPPEIEIIEPFEQTTALPADSPLTIRVRALDPDFALQRVTLSRLAVRQAAEPRQDPQQELLEPVIDQLNGQAAETISQFVLQPQDLGLRPGDRLLVRATAEDTRHPAPNKAWTAEYEIVLEPPATPGQLNAQPLGGRSEPTPTDQAEGQQRGEHPDGAVGPPGAGSEAATPASQDQAAGQGGQQSAEEQAAQTAEPQSGPGEPTGPSDAIEPPAHSQPGPSDQAEPSGSPQHGETPPADQQQQPATPSGGAEGQANGPPNPDQPAQQQADVEPGRPGGANQQPSRQQADSQRAGGESAGQGEPAERSGEASPSAGQSETASEQNRPSDAEVFERIAEYLQHQQAESASDAPIEPQPGQRPEQTPGGARPPQPAGAPAASPTARSPTPPGQPAGDQTAEQASGQTGRGQPPDRSDAAGGPSERGAGRSQPAAAASERASGGGASEPQAPETPGSQPRGESAEPPGAPGPSQPEADGSATAEQSGQAAQPNQSDRGAQNPDGGRPEQPDGQPAPAPNQATNQARQETSEPPPGESAAGPQSGANRSAPQAPSQPSKQASEQAGQPQEAQQSQPTGTDEAAASDSAARGGDSQGRPGPGGAPQGMRGRTGPGEGESVGGEQPGQADGRPPAEDQPPDAPAEPPNMQYARKATELVLDYLEQRRDRPDPRLLDELQWTPEDWRRFLDRWQRLKEAAEDDPAARGRLEDVLRRLSLAPARAGVRRGGAAVGPPGGLDDAGGRSSPPPEYLDQFNAFRRGAARRR